MSVPGPEATAAADDPLAPLTAALFRPLGVDGVYGRTALYEGVIEQLAAFISRQRDPRAEVLRFPPVMSRRQLEKSGYLKSFPNLLGCVCALHGSEAAIRSAADRHESGGDWTTSLAASDLVLSPAACYPLYPLVASRGRLPAGGLIFDVAADCFRREPSRSLDRLQSFRMREFVRIGSPEEITAFREGWMQRARQLADELALPYTVDVANDPFFGRVGQIMAVSQIQQSLKFELLIPYHRAAKPTACMSFNYHREHFGQVWGLQDSRDELAHTGCVAFGMDRLVVALFANHGVDIARWPASTRRALCM
jgi:seryl-tRNA synthetase